MIMMKWAHDHDGAALYILSAHWLYSVIHKIQIRDTVSKTTILSWLKEDLPLKLWITYYNLHLVYRNRRKTVNENCCEFDDEFRCIAKTNPKHIVCSDIIKCLVCFKIISTVTIYQKCITKMVLTWSNFWNTLQCCVNTIHFLLTLPHNNVWTQLGFWSISAESCQ